MNKEDNKDNSYVDWKVFKQLPIKTITITEEYDDCINTRTTHINKFICEAPVGCGKSTALREWMINTILKSKYILIVPTVNIALEFYTKLNKKINNSGLIRVCVKENAFADFRKAINDFVPIVITTYYTASKCLGCIIESFYSELKNEVGLYKSKDKPGKHCLSGSAIDRIQNKTLKIIEEYTLLIDEAHLLLENISLIEMCREFNKVGLISATIQDISNFSVFRDFTIIHPITSIKYDRNIHIHKMEETMDKQRKEIIQNIPEWLKTYDKILIKVEDKNECNKLKNEISNEYKKALYNSEKKDVEISDDGKFLPDDVQIVIATSSIQAGQSLTENMLSVFIQTPLDTISSAQQFIGRNRNQQSDIHLYLRLKKVPEDKFGFKLSDNRYDSRLNQLRANTWMCMDTDSWKKCLLKLGNVIIDEIIQEQTNESTTSDLPPEFKPSEKDLQKEFRGKKLLYKYFKIKSLSHIPQGYSIKTKVINEKGKRTRVYKLAINNQK